MVALAIRVSKKSYPTDWVSHCGGAKRRCARRLPKDSIATRLEMKKNRSHSPSICTSFASADLSSLDTHRNNDNIARRQRGPLQRLCLLFHEIEIELPLQARVIVLARASRRPRIELLQCLLPSMATTGSCAAAIGATARSNLPQLGISQP